MEIEVRYPGNMIYSININAETASYIAAAAILDDISTKFRWKREEDKND